MTESPTVAQEIEELRNLARSAIQDEQLSRLLDRILGILSGHEASLSLLRAETSGEAEDEDLDIESSSDVPDATSEEA